MRRWVMVLATLALLSGVAAAQQPAKHIYSNDYQGKEPPEIAIPAEGWINSSEPLSLKGLRGRVVWLEFSFTH